MPDLTYDPTRLRSHVPALLSGAAFFDGPGGTQTPAVVADAIAQALKAPLSNRGRTTQPERNADDITCAAREAVADLVNADPNGVVFGRSMTQITFDIARSLAREWGPGDEVVVSRLDHDGNIRPWVHYAEQSGAQVRWVDFDPDTAELSVDAVAAVVNDRTRLVAITGASNLLGTRPDIPAIADVVHSTSALFFVDGVHLTAHAPVDMRALGADFYICSPYKFLGPHCGALAASPALLETLHPDKLRPSTEQVPERFELGTLPYELLAGVTVAIDVLADLVPGDEATMERRARIMRSMAALEAYEDDLHARLRSSLAALGGITFFSNAAHRTPTELIQVAGVSSASVSEHLAEVGVYAPAGSFYAIEAAEHLGLGEAGAVRVGLAPYSTIDDVDRLVAGIRDLLPT
jgi:cysteine desulfurase family protein (TIGR01976 family)